MDLLRFCRGEVALREKADVAAWQQTLTSLFNLELRTGFPLSALSSDAFREAERRSRNAEEALLAAVNACARVRQKRVMFEWPHGFSAGAMLHRLRGQRHWIERSVALACLSQLCLYLQNLYRQDLDHGDLSGADLRKTNLVGADFFGADLSGADLMQAGLGRADLSGAELIQADLSRAHLGGTHLFGADLSRADLIQANLNGADASQANLNEADLSETDLSGANLIEANLSQTNLNGANLSGAVLRKADFGGAELREAKNLTREQIESARDIRGATLPDDLKDLEVPLNDESEATDE